MEIAENITWTEELERLDVLLSQGQFELLLPGERYGGGEKEIWLVYLMNMRKAPTFSSARECTASRKNRQKQKNLSI